MSATSCPASTYVLVSSTHDHEGPDSLGLWGPTPFQRGVDADYLNAVEKKIVAAVRDADAAVQPVAARIGAVQAPELLHDAREPYVKHDELVALEFRTVKDDKPAGLVVQWNCHPETLGIGEHRDQRGLRRLHRERRCRTRTIVRWCT